MAGPCPSRTLLAIAFAAAASLWSPPARAKPIGPTILCEVYPDAPACIGGKPACTHCHRTPPDRNAYGAALEAALLPGAPRPLSDADYAANLPSALRAVEAGDADGDGFKNVDEITAGTLPGDKYSFPFVAGCSGGAPNPYWDVCKVDRRYVFRKINLDFCGRSPRYEELEAFKAMGPEEQADELEATLDRCLESEFWIGRDGKVWQLANRKIRPLQAVKGGPIDRGVIPLADYFDDYNLFVWANTGDRDVRDLLTADYFVTRSEGERTTYARVENLSGQNIPKERRAGMLTTQWNLVYHVMFTALPRTAAAQAYRAYLNLDIAKQEGLNPVAGEPVDYDQKGVREAACMICHSTLDPLSYPFKNYDGLKTNPFGSYVPNRIDRFFRNDAPNITSMPEAGQILGQPVADLRAWARTAVERDEFAAAVVMDYWRYLLGGKPTSADVDEYQRLWKRLKNEHGYRVEKMLHDLVKTEAYGVP